MPGPAKIKKQAVSLRPHCPMVYFVVSYYVEDYKIQFFGLKDTIAFFFKGYNFCPYMTGSYSAFKLRMPGCPENCILKNVG
jgi:hypothetical protein